MIELSRVEGFYRVAKAGGYAHAARVHPYPITAPALHQQVRKLERELGVSLFVRVGKERLVPTSEGRTLLEFAGPFFVELPAVVRAIASGKHGGALRVEAATMELQHVLPRWMARLSRARPDLRIELSEVDAADPQRLLSGDVDLVVDHIPALPAAVASRRVATYRAFIVAAKRLLPAAARRDRLPRALAGVPFIGFLPRSAQRALQDAGLLQLGLAPDISLTASSTDAILALVREGLGYSLIAWPTAQGPAIERVTALPLRGAGTQIEVVAAFRARPTPDPWIEAALAVAPLGR